MEDRILKVESRIIRLAQAMLPLEKDIELLKRETKTLGEFKSRLEGQLDLIKWLVVAIPILAAVANAAITWVILKGH